MKIPQGVYPENGYTKIRIWLGPKRNSDGTENKPYRRSMGPWTNGNIQIAKTHIEAVRKAFKNGVGLEPQPEPVGFTALSHIYFDKHWKNKRGRAANSIKNTEYLLIRLRRLWASMAWHSFRSQTIEDYVTLRKKEGLASSTINRELAIISSMFAMVDRWVARREIGPFLLPTTTHGATFNPAEFVDREPVAEGERERVASDEELAKVYVYCRDNDSDMWVAIERAILVGLRKADLEKVNGLLKVKGVLSKSKEKKLFRFPIDFSRKISYKNFDRRWDKVRAACGMKDFHWHDWRHTSATLLSKLGFTTKEVQKFLGHATEEMTEKYINRGKDRFAPEIKALADHLGKVASGVSLAVPTDPTKKRCRGCSELKPLEGYYHHAAFKSGLDSRCKACRDKERDARRVADPGLRAREYARFKAKSQGNGASAHV